MTNGYRRPSSSRRTTTIAILGAGGFIGSHMVESLLSQAGYRVLGVDLTDEKLAGIAGDNFTFRRADIRHDRALVDQVVSEADVVVDLVAYANPSMYVTRPLDVFELNFVQNLEIVKLCIKHGARLIQYSSAEVYGMAAHGDAYREDRTESVFGPVHKQRWIYGISKQLLERVLYAYGAAGQLEYTIVRPFNFVGSRMDYLVGPNAGGGPRLFAHFVSALLTGGPMRLVDGGWAHRSFLSIDDANTAFRTLLDDRERARNRIFNVGNPANHASVREIALLMQDLYYELTGCPPKSELVEISGEEFYGPGYEDATRLPPDISRMRELGWAPRHDLRESFRRAMRYYLEEPAGIHEVQAQLVAGAHGASLLAMQDRHPGPGA